MKRKYTKWILIFLGAVIVLPFGLELFVKTGIGQIHKTPYTQSDILSYIVTVGGVLISMIALLRTKSLEETSFKIKHARTVTADNKDAVVIEIVNEGIYDCEVIGLGFANKKHNYHTSLTPPFTIKAKGCYQIIKDIGTVSKSLKNITEHSEKNKVYYEIHTGIGQSTYLDIGDLMQYVGEEAHMSKRKGTKNTNKDNPQLEQKINEDVKKISYQDWAAIISIATAILTVVIKILVYVCRSAYFNFWNIPREYISLEEGNAIYELLIAVAAAFVAVIVCNLIWFVLKDVIKQHKIVSSIVASIIAIALSGAIYVITWRANAYTWEQIWIYISTGIRAFCVQVILLAVVIVILYICSILIFKGVLDIVSQERTIKKWNIQGIIIIICGIVVSFILLCFTIYSNAYSTLANEKRLDVVTIDNKHYVVISKLENEWIIKECDMDGNQIFVCQDEYCFEDLKSYIIRRYENEITNGNCKKNRESFNTLLDSGTW